jgi:hypothetical protein
MKTILLLSGLLLGGFEAQAQSISSAATADTVGHPGPGFYSAIRYYLGAVTKMDGTTITAYFPGSRAGYGGGNLLYFVPPLAEGQLSNRKTINIPDIKVMAVHGRLYEPVQHKGKRTDILALKLIAGPVSVSTFADARSIPLPIPLGGIGMPMPMVNIPLSDKNRYYLSRSGDYTELHRARFAEEMSTYLSDNADLASKVARQEPNYQYANLIAIVEEYNRGRGDR